MASSDIRTGHFIWFELLTPDPAAAVQFYGKVVGWSSRDAGMPQPYTLLLAQDVPAGGVMRLTEELAARGVPPHWASYIATSDIAGTVARIKEQGGQVHWGPEKIETVGTLAAVADPQGASFSLLEPDPGAERPPEPALYTQGHAGWHELHAVDGASAFAFYRDLFGWTPNQTVDMGPQGVYQTFDTGDVWAGGVFTKMAHTPHPHWLVYFNVESAAAAAARVTEAGGTVVFGPQVVPGGSIIVQARDPQGGMFAVVAREP